MRAHTLAIALLALLPALGMAQSIQLVTDEEAKLPVASQAASRAITRGPGVKLLTPDTVARGSFPFKVAFEPRGGSKVDPASVQITLLKGPAIDLTPRMKNAIRADGIEVATASAAAGEHPIRITVRDDEGRQGSALIQLTVK